MCIRDSAVAAAEPAVRAAIAITETTIVLWTVVAVSEASVVVRAACITETKIGRAHV